MHSTTLTGNLFDILANFAMENEDNCAKEDTARPICATTVTTPETVAADDYRPDADEFEIIREDDNDEDEDPDPDIMHTSLDLLALEEQHKHKPIFTKVLLRRIAKDVARIQFNQSKPVGNRTFRFIHYRQPNGRSIRIWKALDNANSITVNYMTRVELHPTFQARLDSTHKRSQQLQCLNPNSKDSISVPYFIESYSRLPNTTHLNPTRMHQWRQKLEHTQSLWQFSASRITLLDAIRTGTPVLKTPITKIVCLGLGKLNADPAWYQSALQHMSVFSIAEYLDRFNKTKWPKAEKVEIVAQDPCYEACDRILLQELTDTRVDFGLSDPEALLAIGANTLVVSAFLPTSVPLMQIMADMFAKEKGPAMILWDKVEGMRMEKRWYCMRNRDAPGVPRFLRSYRRWERGSGMLEKELKEDFWGDGKEWKYWLNEMDFWLRNDGTR